MYAPLIVKIPIKTISEANTHEHWTKSSKRHKAQKKAVKIFLLSAIPNPEILLPCFIKITRIAPRNLDFDNLCCSQKFIVDALCDYLIPGLRAGRADGDERIKKIEYFQRKERPKEYGVEIEIYRI